MATSTLTTEFFKAGGTLPEYAPSYVERPADDLLFNQVAAGQLCYVLTPRQMGKSSLMIRTVTRLQATGIHTAIVDLSALGVHVSSAQWYLGILTSLAEELQLALDVQAWWQARASLGIVRGKRRRQVSPALAPWFFVTDPAIIQPSAFDVE